MSKFNFNSQICTSREQSERLLKLGLKKETADMGYVLLNNGECALGVSKGAYSLDIPAWSLHRLMLLNKGCYIEFMNDCAIDNAYDVMIDEIELAIKNRQFNNAYLE